ncbi:hypothetical protein E5K02_23020 [Hymenobacter metallicola]|uniref:Uncharacterized protein n=2 Tax=Hymenobacter metallicola TaxID=2563114 RepID=A0A4Z0PXW5_9BACT|nr:hypothetical protein E5K02_23020 [Hymenobacter metallicola]
MKKTSPEMSASNQPVYHFQHRENGSLIVVRGELSDFYGFYDIEEFAGTDQQDAAQRADAGYWKDLTDFLYLEVPAEGAPRILELVAGTVDQVQDVTAQHPGPFRIPGRVPFTATDQADEYATLSDLAAEMKPQPAQYRGRIVAQGGLLRWFAFEEEMGGSGECPWEPVELNLGAYPHDSYAYHSGKRATPEQGQSYGTVTLWQQPDGAQRYYVEIAPTEGHAFPYLVAHTPAEVRSWYDFRFTPYAPPTV